MQSFECFCGAMDGKPKRGERKEKKIGLPIGGKVWLETGEITLTLASKIISWKL
jgi:hypothetical protein